MCWNGYDPPRDEDQWEEGDGELDFLPDTTEDWRLGPIGPEEQMFRKMIEDDDPEDGS